MNESSEHSLSLSFPGLRTERARERVSGRRAGAHARTHTHSLSHVASCAFASLRQRCCVSCTHTPRGLRLRKRLSLPFSLCLADSHDERRGTHRLSLSLSHPFSRCSRVVCPPALLCPHSLAHTHTLSLSRSHCLTTTSSSATAGFQVVCVYVFV